MITCNFESGDQVSLRHTAAAAIIQNDQSQILFIKRASHLLEGNKWGLPGGFIDRDESVTDGAAREVLEETGWEVENLKLLHIKDNPDRPKEDRQNIEFVFTGKPTERTGTPDEESLDVVWFDLDNLPKDDDIAFDHALSLKIYFSNKSPDILT